MTLKVLKHIGKDINKSVFNCVISDKVTGSANSEEFIICFSWIDDL